MARYKITDFLQSASAGRHAADGDRPRSGGRIEMRPTNAETTNRPAALELLSCGHQKLNLLVRPKHRIARTSGPSTRWPGLIPPPARWSPPGPPVARPRLRQPEASPAGIPAKTTPPPGPGRMQRPALTPA